MAETMRENGYCFLGAFHIHCVSIGSIFLFLKHFITKIIHKMLAKTLANLLAGINLLKYLQIELAD